jgi:anti-sigma regulatory factor (Ser/Thr protein kinase)
MLSELSANAVMHSGSGKPGGTFIVRLQHSPGNWVWGEVEDHGSCWDGDLPASARDWSGLFFVRALASACGVAEETGRHRVVWFWMQCRQQCTGEAGR